MPAPAELIRKIRRIEITTRRAVLDTLAGGYHSVFKGRGMAFSEVRPYQPGDEIRAIDWNVTPRMGDPFVKVFAEGRALTALVAAGGGLRGGRLPRRGLRGAAGRLRAAPRRHPGGGERPGRGRAAGGRPVRPVARRRRRDRSDGVGGPLRLAHAARLRGGGARGA